MIFDTRFMSSRNVERLESVHDKQTDLYVEAPLVMVLHMSASTVRIHRLNILSTSVTLLLSRFSALTTSVTHAELLSFWRGHRQRTGPRETPRYDLFTTRVSVPVVKRREFVISLDLQSRPSTTRTGGDRLTLLYVYTITVYYMHGYMIACLSTRTRSPSSFHPSPSTLLPKLFFFCPHVPTYMVLPRSQGCFQQLIISKAAPRSFHTSASRALGGQQEYHIACLLCCPCRGLND